MFGPDIYILDADRRPVAAASYLEWAIWFEQPENARYRVVEQSRLGTVFISTVFMGLDHNFLRRGAPILYETLIFGGRYDGQMWRCSTVEQAIAIHTAVANAVLRRSKPSTKKLVKIAWQRRGFVSAGYLHVNPEDILYEPQHHHYGRKNSRRYRGIVYRSMSKSKRAEL